MPSWQPWSSQKFESESQIGSGSDEAAKITASPGSLAAQIGAAGDNSWHFGRHCSLLHGAVSCRNELFSLDDQSHDLPVTTAHSQEARIVGKSKEQWSTGCSESITLNCTHVRSCPTCGGNWQVVRQTMVHCPGTARPRDSSPAE
jgi:hypothetical protein